MTIHKAQGLSLDRALVDLGQCWGAGQAYVALSRCRSLAGLQIRSFSPSVFKADPKCLMFYDHLIDKPARRLITDCFDQKKQYEEFVMEGLSLFFDQLDPRSSGDDRNKQIFLETVADLYDEAQKLHQARKVYSSPRKLIIQSTDSERLGIDLVNRSVQTMSHDKAESASSSMLSRCKRQMSPNTEGALLADHYSPIMKPSQRDNGLDSPATPAPSAYTSPKVESPLFLPDSPFSPPRKRPTHLDVDFSQRRYKSPRHIAEMIDLT